MGRVNHFQVSAVLNAELQGFQINGETGSLILNYLAIFLCIENFCRNIRHKAFHL